jgi:DNA-binding transcriptional LysR family regulator
MELRQLEYAVAVADHGGFTRAAAARHVSQPALSQGIQALERELAVVLFDRLGRHVSVTAAGEAFLGPARQVLRDVETLRAAVAGVRGLTAGHLDVVALPTLAVDPVATLVGAFRREHGGVTVRLAEPEDADAVVEMVRDGRCEIGLGATPFPDDLVVRHAFAQEILAVCPPGTRLDRTGRLPVERLASMPLVTTPPGTSTRRLVTDALAQASVVPTVAVETGQREAILPLVLAGAGTTFLPPTLAAAAGERGAVVARLEPEVRRQVALVTRSGPLSPAAEAFVAIALRVLAVERRVLRR